MDSTQHSLEGGYFQKKKGGDICQGAMHVARTLDHLSVVHSTTVKHGDRLNPLTPLQKNHNQNALASLELHPW